VFDAWILPSRVVDPSKKVPNLNFEVQDLLLEVVDFKYEVPDLRSGGIPHNLIPATMTFTGWMFPNVSSSNCA